MTGQLDKETIEQLKDMLSGKIVSVARDYSTRDRGMFLDFIDSLKPYESEQEKLIRSIKAIEKW